jgi:hypothetical protein
MHCRYLQVMLATCVLSNSTDLQLSAENQTEFASRFRELVKERKFILSKEVFCTTEGLTEISCTTYKVCASVNGNLLGVIAKCYPDSFNPVTLKCDPDYICPPCVTIGFICLKNNRAFRLCGEGGATIIKEQDCPAGYYCNEKCLHPCTRNVADC